MRGQFAALRTQHSALSTDHSALSAQRPALRIPHSALTAQRLLSQAREGLRKAEVDSPALTSLVLLEQALGLRRERIVAHPELVVPPDVASRYHSWVERRCQREPLAYILGWREFYGRSFAVSRDTLVPRPETEGLVHLALQRIRDRPALRLLEVGTGTGAVAITLLCEAPALHAVATDIDAAALQVALRNAQRHEVEQRLRLVASDLDGALLSSQGSGVRGQGSGVRGQGSGVRGQYSAFPTPQSPIHHPHSVLRTQHSALSTQHSALAAPQSAIRTPHCTPGRFPLVVANLPYVPTDCIDALDPEVASYEPRRALDGGQSGTEVIRAFLHSLPRRLAPGGAAFLEMGEGQAETLATCAREVIPRSTVRVECDLAGIERFLVIDTPSS